MIDDYLQELYKLYIEPPFLTYEKLVKYISENYNIEISYQKLREYMTTAYPQIKQIKIANREKFKFKYNDILSELQLKELYKLYTEPPFMSYEYLAKYVKEEYDIEIHTLKLREYIINAFPKITEIKIENREKLKGKWNPIFTEDQLRELHRLVTSPPYMDYKMLAEYSNKKFNIEINEDKIRRFLFETFPDISQEINEIKDERTFYRDGTAVSAEEKRTIIELLSEGYNQSEVASLVNISQAQVSRILKKSKLEIQEIKKNRILSKIRSIKLEDIKTLWNKSLSMNEVYDELIGLRYKVSVDDVKYVLKEILNVKKRCKICGNEIDLEHIGLFCSSKCKRESRLDSRRTQQHNRRVKSGGKTTQAISRYSKIKEADEICYLCGEKLDTKVKDKYHPLYIVLDHVNPIIHSNDSSEDNIKPVCRCCNTMKGDKEKDYYSTEEYKNNRKIKIQQYTPREDNYELIDTQEFIKDCDNGMTIKELCRKYNRSNFIIWKMKQNLGVAHKDKIHNKLNQEYAVQEVAFLTQEGKSIREIVGILNIAPATVSKYRKQAVIKGILNKSNK